MQNTLHTRKPSEWLQNQLDKKKLTNKQNYIPQGLIANILAVKVNKACSQMQALFSVYAPTHDVAPSAVSIADAIDAIS